MDGNPLRIWVLRGGVEALGPRLESETSFPWVSCPQGGAPARIGGWAWGQRAGLGEASSLLTVFILSVIMGSDTPRCLLGIIAGPVISSISRTFTQTVINQVSLPPCPPSWWKPRHREMRLLSQHHTANSTRRGCFAPNSLGWEGGVPSPFHLGGASEPAMAGGPCPQFPAPSLP